MFVALLVEHLTRDSQALVHIVVCCILFLSVTYTYINMNMYLPLTLDLCCLGNINLNV
jgi:hypothetical protein